MNKIISLIISLTLAACTGITASAAEDNNATVRDIVFFDHQAAVYDSDGNELLVEPDWKIWIIAVDDQNQRFRVQVPKLTPTGDKVTYLPFEYASDLKIVSHEGQAVGDLDHNGTVNVFDMCLIRRFYAYGTETSSNRLLSDINADGQFTIADAVVLQQWLLGEIR